MKVSAGIDYQAFSSFVVMLEELIANKTEFFCEELLDVLERCFGHRYLTLFIFEDYRQDKVSKLYVHTPDKVISDTMLKKYEAYYAREDVFFSRLSKIASGSEPGSFRVYNSDECLSAEEKKAYSKTLGSLGLGSRSVSILLDKYRLSFHKRTVSDEFDSGEIEKISYVAELIYYKWKTFCVWNMYTEKTEKSSRRGFSIIDDHNNMIISDGSESQDIRSLIASDLMDHGSSPAGNDVKKEGTHYIYNGKYYDVFCGKISEEDRSDICFYTIVPTGADNSRNVFSELTDREYEIIVALTKGMKYEEIARLLSISAHTVSNHLKNIYRKINVKNQRELLNWYFAKKH